MPSAPPASGSLTPKGTETPGHLGHMTNKQDQPACPFFRSFSAATAGRDCGALWSKKKSSLWLELGTFQARSEVAHRHGRATTGSCNDQVSTRERYFWPCALSGRDRAVEPVESKRLSRLKINISICIDLRMN